MVKGGSSMTLRIVSLCPSNTESVCALGLADALVGVDLYSDWPPDVVQHLPRVGPDLQIDVEKVKSLRPHLVLASLSVPGMERVVEAVHDAGLPVLVLNPTSLEEMLSSLGQIAQAAADLGRPVDVESVQSGLRQRIQRVAQRTRDCAARPKLYWEWWPNPIFSPARDNWLTELSRIAGGHNVFADERGSGLRDPTGERVIESEPDFIFAVWTGIPQHKVPLLKIARRPGWGRLTAVANRHVYALSESLFCRPSPRLVDGLEQLIRLIHPEIADDLQLPPAEAYAPVRRLPVP
jgi:iron complex transport system substrate-binding protein